jgi:hypothetical protein
MIFKNQEEQLGNCESWACLEKEKRSHKGKKKEAWESK